MESRHVFARGVSFDELGFDLIQGHGRSVDDPRCLWTVRQQFLRDHRAGVQADRAAGQQVPATDSDQIGGAGSGAYEVDGHDVVVSARAQVTGPATTRGCSSRGFVPFVVAPANAAASATESTFMAAMECVERVTVAGLAASNASWEIANNGTPQAAAVACMPGSLVFAAGVAIAVTFARPHAVVNANSAMAASIAASTCAALTPARHPIPATITPSPRSTAQSGCRVANS
jgi:hypothetical protein